MTRREKVLAACVGGAVAGALLIGLVKRAVIQPFEDLKDAIRKEQRRASVLRTNLRKLQDVEQQWQALTRRTFADSADPQQAERLFREDLHRLLERHGLRDPKIVPGTFIKYKDGAVAVPLTINATGTLNQVVGFLRDFYRRDCLARLDKVRLTTEQNVVADTNASGRRGAGRKVAIGPDGPELKVNISAITLTLPRLSDVAHPVMEGLPEELDHGRLAEADLATYNAIFEKNLFMPYQEKPPVVTQTTRPAAPTSPTVATKPPPVVDQRRGAEFKYLRGTAQLNGQPIAYVIDEQNKQRPPLEYHLDEAFDDGTLILIHPRGVVVRVAAAGSPKDYFYALGASFRDRVELNPDEHPEVWDALQQELVTDEGAVPPDGQGAAGSRAAEGGRGDRTS